MEDKFKILKPKSDKPKGTDAAVRTELRQTTLKTKKKIAAAFKAMQQNTKTN